MTEYEAATLATRYAALVIAAILGSTQCILIWIGLRFMRGAAESRDKGLERQGKADEKRHNEAMKALADRHAATMKAEADRHAEVMQAFERQERESDRRHTEAMEAAERRERESLRRHEETMLAFERQRGDAEKRHAESMAVLDTQRQAMETLIERTAPADARG